MLTAASWIRPFGHHLWKRKTFLLAILIILLFVLLFTQYSELNSNSPGRPSLDSINKYLSFQRPSADSNYGAVQSGAVLPRPLSLNTVYKNVHSPIRKDYGSEQPLVLPSGEPSDEETKLRRDKIREMMDFAWSNYVKYAWGENELKPISKKPHQNSIFGKGKLGRLFTYVMGDPSSFFLTNHFLIHRGHNCRLNGHVIYHGVP